MFIVGLVQNRNGGLHIVPEGWEDVPGAASCCKLIQDNEGHVLAAEGTTLASVSQDKTGDSQGE